ncbi:MAG: AAA family ATPase, partial [Chloroflexi bacterium]|nr:AAA family ATPase [Chloroflexota bacterium]
MKVTIQNLGVIQKAEIDLRPLTIFIGPNNAGKTWLAYGLAGILGPYGYGEYARAYSTKDVPERYTPIDIAIQQLIDEGSTKIDLVPFAEEHGEVYFNNVALLAKSWMRRFMGTEKVSFEDLAIHLSLAETKEHLRKRVLNFSLEDNRAVGRGKRKPLLTALKEPGKRDLYIYTSSSVEEVSERLPLRAITEFLINNVFRVLHRSLYSDTYTFPAERADLIPFSTTTKVERQTTTTGELAQREQRARLTPWYMLSFTAMILKLFDSNVSERKEEANSDEAVRAYIELARRLGQQILGGDVDFSTPEPDPRREIIFQTTAGVILDVPVVSSMVKELSLLVLYLRYLAKPGDLLVIDEPEMNMHPEVQAQIIEFLAMLVNAGLNILITSHSTYVVDHLTNLMKAAENEKPEAISSKFYLKRTDAFISKDKVSVYFVNQGTTTNVLDENGTIHWETFSKVSDRVEQI